LQYQNQTVMKKDTYTTDVIFRKFKDNQIIAIFPHDVSDRQGNVNSYMHVGQHSSADYVGVLTQTKPATDTECKLLKTELEGLGYNLNVIKRINRDKYLKSYKETLTVNQIN
jgi:hypothetical protein